MLRRRHRRRRRRHLGPPAAFDIRRRDSSDGRRLPTVRYFDVETETPRRREREEI